MILKRLFDWTGAVCCVFLPFALWAQDSATVSPERRTEPYVSWVSQYPVRKEKVKANALKRTYQFLVGKSREDALLRPVGVLAGNPASFWVLDQGKETLFDIEKNKSTTPKAIRKKENYFTSLVGICAMPGNDLLFTDSRLNKVFRYHEADNMLEPVNDTLSLIQPTGLAYNPVSREIWVAETGAHRLTVLNDSGAVVRRIGGRGDGGGQFNFPTSIWIDSKGDVYVVDAMNFRVQIFDKNGAFVTMFGEAGDQGGTFARPKGIATDSYGHIYVSDALFHAVQIFDRAGNFLYSFGKQGRDKEEFWMPSGLYIDSNNYIYVSDSYNSRVQVFQLINGGG